jgi:hypothetical protein
VVGWAVDWFRVSPRDVTTGLPPLQLPTPSSLLPRKSEMAVREKGNGGTRGVNCLPAASLLNHPFCFHPPLAFLNLPGSIVQKDLHTCCPSPKMRPVIELQVPARQDPESNPYWKGNLIWVPLAGRHLFELRTGGGYHYQDL